MKKTALLLSLGTALALTAFAQDKKPDGAKPKAADAQAPAKAAERPKDDPVTAKDAAIVEMDKFIQTALPEKRPDDWRTTLKLPPKLTFTKDMQYEWHVKTNKGDITVRLLADVAPMHVSNTIYLARTGFYDGLKFHRVIKGFMAQGGDPLGNGRGGPGYQFDGEFSEQVKHDKPGRLSMANRGPGTDGSQFFLTFVPTAHLDGKHTIFGEVTSGMETLKALEAAGSENGATSEPLSIVQSWIVVAPAPKTEEPKKEEPKKTDGK